MTKSTKSSRLSLLIFISLFIVNGCGGDEDKMSESIDCDVEVSKCLTNGSTQTYFVFSTDGEITTSNCFLSIRMTFQGDGTFIFDSDGDTDMNCRDRVGFDNFTGNWSLENNDTEIHITPPWFTDEGQTKTILKIISLDEVDLTAETPTQGGQTIKVWRRIQFKS